MITVLKYGGSSVATTTKISEIANYLYIRSRNEKLIVIVSAMGKTTNQLISLANEISDSPDLRELDSLLATGEQQTIALLAIALKNKKVRAISLTGWQASIITNTNHTKSSICDIETTKLMAHIENNDVVIIAGFQGISEDGNITTLGRGGSDTSAIAIAAALNCRAEIYTDVDGIYTVDPRCYPKALKIDSICYEEMMEMSNLGSKVMEVRSIELASKYNVPILVKKSLEKGEGTMITQNVQINEERPIRGLSTVDDIITIEITNLNDAPGTLSSIFKVFSKYGVSVGMISQTNTYDNTRISFIIHKNDELLFAKVVNEVQRENPHYNFNINNNLLQLSIIGIGLSSNVGIAASVFEVLGNNGITIISVSSSEISLSITILKENKDIAIKSLAQHFNL